MTSSNRHHRRAFLLASAGVVGGLAATKAWERASQNALKQPLPSLDALAQHIVRLSSGTPPASNTAFNWAQTLTHCAQSIDCSMTGYPVHKPEFFKATVGAAAFRVFAWRQRMSHDLDAPIPGVTPDGTIIRSEQAVARLLASIERFQQWEGPLQPHFAYGALSKQDYEIAHALHIADHVSTFARPVSRSQV